MYAMERQEPIERLLLDEGRVAVVEQFGELVGISLEEVGGRHNHLAPVWENGKLLRDWSFDEVKARAQGAGL